MAKPFKVVPSPVTAPAGTPGAESPPPGSAGQKSRSAGTQMPDAGNMPGECPKQNDIAWPPAQQSPEGGKPFKLK